MISNSCKSDLLTVKSRNTGVRYDLLWVIAWQSYCLQVGKFVNLASSCIYLKIGLVGLNSRNELTLSITKSFWKQKLWQWLFLKQQSNAFAKVFNNKNNFPWIDESKHIVESSLIFVLKSKIRLGRCWKCCLICHTF